MVPIRPVPKYPVTPGASRQSLLQPNGYFNPLGKTKDGGLIGQLSSNAKRTFHPCTFFRQPSRFQRVHSAALYTM